MGQLLPKHFRFSPLITAISLTLAGLMVWASTWQWQRYLYKKELVASYQAHSVSLPEPFPLNGSKAEDFEKVVHKKVELTGSYDFSRQLIVLNRRHSSGPGYWLLTPFKPENSETWLLVSRGFIPFKDDNAESWQKYSFDERETFEAVVQETVPHRSLLAPDSKAGNLSQQSFTDKWRYPDLEKIAAQYPYPLQTAVFLQRLGGPPKGEFPAEAVSIRVPPSTHFGYAIEWALLALAALVVGFLLQALPKKKKTTGVTQRRRLQAVGAAMLLLPLSSSSAKATEKAGLVPQQAKVIEHLGKTIDLSLKFTTAEGKQIELGDAILPGKPLIVAPVYYECPQLCTLTQSGLVKALNQLKLQIGEDFSVASISFNPKESAEFAQRKASKYRGMLECGRQDGNCSAKSWEFLIGEQASIKSLTSQLGFEYVPDGKDFIHAAVLMVLTPDGKLSRYLYGVEFPEQDVRLALLEASKGQIGNTFQRVLLYCFRYDHLQGKYTISIMRVVRVVSLAVFFLLIACLVGLRVKEKRLSNTGRTAG